MYRYGDFLSNSAYDALNERELLDYHDSLPKVWEYALCGGRHDMPTYLDGAIFPTTVSPTNPSDLKAAADAAIPDDCHRLVVYVTGLTVAMLAVVSVCIARRISLTAMHYDRETGHYFSQVVTTFAGEFPTRKED